MQASTLRPGYLVSLNTSIRGNVSYDKRDIEADHATGDGKRRARWETTREIADPVEFEAAKIARGKARTAITRVCAASAFGLLCPDDRAGDLDAAIIEARAVADSFNASARLSRISVYIITGRIAPDDAEAVRAINSEVRDLLDTMTQGIRNLEVESVREAANKARALGSMLSPGANEKVLAAVTAARTAARQIVKAGEQAATEIDEASIRAITEARTAFLDLEPAVEIQTPMVDGRAIEFEPMPVEIPVAAQSVPTLEM